MPWIQNSTEFLQEIMRHLQLQWQLQKLFYLLVLVNHFGLITLSLPIKSRTTKIHLSMAQEVDSITIESLSTTDTYNTAQWKKTPLYIFKYALNIVRVGTVSGQAAKLSKATRDYFDVGHDSWPVHWATIGHVFQTRQRRCGSWFTFICGLVVHINQWNCNCFGGKNQLSTKVF